MAWLKEWDECVFKRQLGAGSKKRLRAEAAAMEGGTSTFDPLGRPKQKVRLLRIPSRPRLSQLTYLPDSSTDPPYVRAAWIGKDDIGQHSRNSGRVQRLGDQRQVRTTAPHLVCRSNSGELIR